MASAGSTEGHTGQSVLVLYLTIGRVLGVVAAFVTFFACWISGIARFGFLIGVAFGWFPSSIVAAIVGGLVTFLWGLVLLIALVAGVAVWNSEHSNIASSSPATASYAAGSEAAVAASAAVDASTAAAAMASTPTPPASSPPDMKQIATAVDALEDMIPTQGLAGAISYAMKCYAGLASAPSWPDWDRCASFDQYSFEKFGRNNWQAQTQYFDAASVGARQERAISQLSADGVANNDRIAAIRGLVDQATADRPARLAAAQAQQVAQASAAASVDAAAQVPTDSPSFDCSRVQSENLKLVCATPDLARDDRELAVAYRQAMASAPDKAALRRGQQAWIRARNASPPQVGSLDIMYQARMEELKQLGGNAPSQSAAGSPH
jgi:uncharacterized protein YecT (DUF1311 family)